MSKQTNKKTTIASMILLMKPYILKHKWSLILVIILVITSNMLLLSIPSVTGKMIDSIGLGQGKVDFKVLGIAAASIVLLSLAGWLFEFIRNLIMTKTAQAIVFELRQTVFAHLIKLPISFIESNMKGDLMSRISIDIDNISETISSDIITIFTSIVTIFVAFAMMLSISPYLTIIFVVSVPVMLMASRYISGKSRKLFRKKKMQFAALCAHSEEMLTAQKTIKLFGMEDYNTNQYNAISEKLNETGTEADFFSSTMMPTMNFFNNLTFVAISIMGCALLLQGKISIGNISSFIIYSKRFTSPIVETANVYNTLQSAMASCERIYYLLNQEQEKEKDISDNISNLNAPTTVKGEVVFKDVCFSYVKDTPVIKNLSFSVKPGQRVAIVGATGSGKTTITNLLLRFYQADSGAITIDGMNVNDIALSTLRRYYALVLQDNFLFEATVRENIDYAAETGDLERIQAAIDEVEMTEYVQDLPHNFDTMLSNNANNMSVGQKQLLTIARILMTDTSMLIFDEATSSVDTKTEKKIKIATEKLMEGKTSFIIAHRLSTILNCDLILVMSNGVLVEVGTHQQLMEKKNTYYEMYQMQFKEIG